MGARELNNTEPAGSTLAPQLSKPVRVSLREVSEMYVPSRLLRSLGVAQQISPFQWASTDVLGVAPETISAHSSNRALPQTALTEAFSPTLSYPVEFPLPDLRDFSGFVLEVRHQLPHG